MKTKILFSVALLALAFAFKAPMQDAGKISDDFKDGSAPKWKALTKDAKSAVVDNKLVITPSLQADGTYRGDIISVGDVTLNAAKYPILAIKINKKTQVLDTNLGTYKGGPKKIAQADGYDVYYWDITAKQFQRANDPAFDFPKEPTVLKKVTFKYASLTYSSDEVTNNKTGYGVVWIKTFASETELKESLK